MSITSVTISPDLLVAKVGWEFQLTATVVVTGGESTDVTWASDTANVTVDATGLVIIEDTFTGKATITATSVVDITKKDTTNVTLYPSFSLSVVGISLDVGQTPYAPVIESKIMWFGISNQTVDFKLWYEIYT